MPPLSLGVIHPSELYTLSEFKQRIGLSDGALRQARRAGLHVRYAHRRGYVLGKDWIEYIQSLDRNKDTSSVGKVDRGH